MVGYQGATPGVLKDAILKHFNRKIGAANYLLKAIRFDQSILNDGGVFYAL